MLHGSTCSMSELGERGQPDEKWVTGIRHTWSRRDNLGLMECYYTSNPSQNGYMQRMWDLWMLRNPPSKLTKKQLIAQCSNVGNQQLLSQVVTGYRETWISGGISSSPQDAYIASEANLMKFSI